jgi:hypothetical protein
LNKEINSTTLIGVIVLVVVVLAVIGYRVLVPHTNPNGLEEMRKHMGGGPPAAAGQPGH